MIDQLMDAGNLQLCSDERRGVRRRLGVGQRHGRHDVVGERMAAQRARAKTFAVQFAHSHDGHLHPHFHHGDGGQLRHMHRHRQEPVHAVGHQLLSVQSGNCRYAHAHLQ